MTGKPKLLQLGHFWSTWKPLIRTRNPQMGQKHQQQQQQQQPFRHRPQMLSTESNCHLGGNREAWRLTLQLTVASSISWTHEATTWLLLSLLGNRKPSASASTGTEAAAAAAAAAAASTTTASMANTRTFTVATATVPDAYGRICSTAAVGHNTLDAHLGHFHFTIMPPLPWPWQRQQQQQHKHSHKHQLDEEEQQQRRGISTRWSTDKAVRT
ncbi:hypothetical protein ACLKA6_005706 [Drosophila palustris]